MQFCDLEDLYKKFNVVKMLRIGRTERPRFNYSGDFSFPESEGDILFQRSKLSDEERNVIPPENVSQEMELSGENAVHTQHSNVAHQSQHLTELENQSANHIIDEKKSEQLADDAVASLSSNNTTPPFSSGSFEGPLTRCLEEEDDILTDELRFVPNNITIRVKIFLPNKYPLYIILRQDATVQDAIEKTIRKSNALCAAFKKRYDQLKQEEEQKKIKEIDNEEAEMPPVDESSPRHDSIDGLSEFLTGENLCPSRREEHQVDEDVVNGVKVKDILGANCMTLIDDTMAYELRMEICDGECDMDFPALERGGILRSFDEGEQNFCLVQVPDYQPRSSTTPISADEQVDIRLMFDDQFFTIELPANSTCRQLLNEARHRLTPGRVYELTVAPEDKERLKMISEVVNENVCLCDLDVTSFRIRLKRFFDGPRIAAFPTYNYHTDGGSHENVVDVTTYMFTNFEAGKYKKWVVWKLTSKGKRRKRVFAIDCDEIFIYHTGSLKMCGGCMSGNETFIFISSIVDVQLDENHPDVFVLFYHDDDYDSDDSDANLSSDDQTTRIVLQAMSVEDSCDIVNRVQHLMRNYR